MRSAPFVSFLFPNGPANPAAAAPVPPFVESFEFSGGWPGTYDADYWRTYTGFDTPSAAFSESFENAGGWPGT